MAPPVGRHDVTSQLDAAGYLALSQIARGQRTGVRVTADSLGALRRRWLFGRHTFWRAAILGALGECDLAIERLKQSNREGQQMQSWHYVTALDSLHGWPAFEMLVRPRR